MAAVAEAVRPNRPILQAEKVSISFGGVQGRPPAEIVKDIDLDVEPGRFIALLGPSGCGKTTFLRAVAGIVPVTAGQIRINGEDPGRGVPSIGMVFQNARLLPWRNVLRNVTYGLELRRRGIRGAQLEEVANRYIELVGLTGFERHYPHQISGGMQQRVNLARALAVDPVLLLMDEPFASLDAQTRELMQFELLRIWARNTKTILFVTHDIAEAIFLADTIYVFSTKPASIMEVIQVPFARPREREIKGVSEFFRIVEHVWRLLEFASRRAQTDGE